LMAAGGMKPWQVLQATTRVAAECLGVEADRGTIAEGKRADLVVLAGDPFDFAGFRERVTAVYLDGRLVAGGV
jgi:imidazolonepropionase-like amidohydrolase